MNESEKPSTIISIIKKNPKLLSQVIVRYVLIYLVAGILGGSFICIVHGFVFGLVKLAPYWEPALKFSLKLLGIRPDESKLTSFRIPWRNTPIKIISIATDAIFIWIGIWYLFKVGFWGQNFIHLAIR